jgi:hypothetical protein
MPAQSRGFYKWDPKMLEKARDFGSSRGADGVAIVRVADARTLPDHQHGEPIRGCDGILQDPIGIKVIVIDLVDGVTSEGFPPNTTLTDASRPFGMNVPRFTAFRRHHGESIPKSER